MLFAITNREPAHRLYTTPRAANDAMLGTILCHRMVINDQARLRACVSPIKVVEVLLAAVAHSNGHWLWHRRYDLAVASTNTPERAMVD